MRRGLTLNGLAKRIAARLKLKTGDVRAVLESKKTDLPKAAVAQIAEAARTLINEELIRLDARRGSETAASRRRE
jgi:hypothetical protein